MAYASRCARARPGWAPLPVQYVDYTLWQRALLGDLADSDSPIAAQLAYWEQSLAGLPERLQLPTDRPYPSVADQRGASVVVDWPAELQQQVAREASEHNATSFMMVQAALAVLLSKLSASPEVAVGFPIAGRRDPALDDLVGFFVNTLVLRVDVTGDPTAAELLAQVRQPQPGRLRAPGCALRGAGRAAQPQSKSWPIIPLIQVMVGWQFAGKQRSRCGAGVGGPAGHVRCRWRPSTARMDLTFSLAERFTEAGEPAGIGGTVEFRTDVFDAESIEALDGRLERVLVAMTADPSRRVSSIDVVDAGEHARLDRWSNRAVLTRPASPAVSIPVCVCARRWRARRRGGDQLRAAFVDLSGAGGGGQPVGALADRSGRGPG